MRQMLQNDIVTLQLILGNTLFMQTSSLKKETSSLRKRTGFVKWFKNIKTILSY